MAGQSQMAHQRDIVNQVFHKYQWLLESFYLFIDNIEPPLHCKSSYR